MLDYKVADGILLHMRGKLIRNKVCLNDHEYNTVKLFCKDNMK